VRIATSASSIRSIVLAGCTAWASVEIPRTALAGTWASPVVDDHYERYATHVEQAEIASRKGEPIVAIEQCGLAYELLPGTERGAELGQGVVDFAIGVAQDAKGHRDEVVVLEQALGLLDRHLDDVRRFAADRDPTSALASRRALAARLEELDQADSVPNPATAQSGPRKQPGLAVEDPSLEPRPDRGSDTRDPDGPSPRRKLALGLIGVGSALTLGGLAVLGYGIGFRVTQDDRLERELAKCMDESCRAMQNDWNEGELDKAREWIIGGAVATPLSVAVLLSGLILLTLPQPNAAEPRRVTHKPSFRHVTLTPSFGRGAGLVLSGQFSL